MRVKSGLLGLLLALRVVAQDRPDVTEILKKVSDTYKAAKDYDLVGEVTVMERGQAAVHGRIRVAFKAPDRYRMEVIGIPGLSLDDSAEDQATMIHNGSTFWFYSPKSNRYAPIPADVLARDPEGSAHTPEVTDRVAVGFFRAAVDHAAESRFLREESIEIAGAKVDCYLISVPRAPGKPTWWVDKTGWRVVRDDHAGSDTTFTTIKLNEPLSDDLFNFTPPPGAKKLDLTQ